MRFRKIKINRKLLSVIGVPFLILVIWAFSTPGQTFIKKASVYFSNISNNELSSKKPNFWLPPGRETYKIVQAEGVHPKIHEATIDPPDVHVGDKQTLSILVSDEKGIGSVVAKIETDNGIKELPLKFVREVKPSELKPISYEVNEKSELAVLKEEKEFADSRFIKSAEAGNPPILLYENSWIVRDTHDKKYHTTFVAKNSAGEENSITLAWSDACGIPYVGSWNINTYGNCTISSVDGVDTGTTTIATYTLTLNSTFGWNPGYGVVINSGAIAIGTGGGLKQGYVWAGDGDSDSYVNGTMLVQDTQPVGYIRRGTSAGYDCNDANGNIYRIVSGGKDADHEGYIEGSAATDECVGGDNLFNGRWYSWNAITNSYSWLISTSLLGLSDCDDVAAQAWYLKNLYKDADYDGRAPSNTLYNVCVGNTFVQNTRTYYYNNEVGVPCNPQYIETGILQYSDIDDCNGAIWDPIQG